jgi:hypothetical protein
MLTSDEETRRESAAGEAGNAKLARLRADEIQYWG